MKRVVRKTIPVAIAAFMAVAAAGCGKSIESTETVVTVDNASADFGTVAMYVRYGQSEIYKYYNDIYTAYGMETGNIWKADSDDEKYKTYGDQFKGNAMEDIELMLVCESRAQDYGVSIDDDEKEEIKGAAKEFFEKTDRKILDNNSITEASVERMLELFTYKAKVKSEVVKDADHEVSDEESVQTTIRYVQTEDEQAAKEILSAVEDGGDFEEAVSDKEFSSETVSFTAANPDADNIPEELIKGLDGKEEGEFTLIETDDGLYYVASVTARNDETATEQKKEEIIQEREDELFNTTTEEWLDNAKIDLDKKLYKKIKVSDREVYIAVTDNVEVSDTKEDVSEEDAAEENTDAEDVDENEDFNAEDVGETEEDN